MAENMPQNDAVSTAAKPQESETLVKSPVEPIWSAEDVLSHSKAADAAKCAVTLVIPYLVFKAIFHHTWNPARRQKNDHIALYPNIMAVGVIKPITVSCRVTLKAFEALLEAGNTKGMIKALWALTGHLRQTCIVESQTRDPEVWKDRWSKGVQVDLIFGLNEGQEYFLACDHDTVARSRPAIIEQIIKLFKIGRSHKAIMFELWEELKEAFSQISAKSAKKIAAAETDAERTEAMFSVRRGVLQHLGYFALNFPDECLEALMRDEREEEGPKLKLAAAKDLFGKIGDGSVKNPSAGFTKMLKKKYAEYGTKVESKYRTNKEWETLFKRTGSQSMEAIEMWWKKELDIDLAGEFDSQLCDNEGAGRINLPQFEMTKANKAAKAQKAAQSDAA